MTSPDGKVALVEEARAGTGGAREAVSPRRVDAASEERQTAEKPQAPEEIVIGEIGVDGMCGVYRDTDRMDLRARPAGVYGNRNCSVIAGAVVLGRILPGLQASVSEG